ncbi:hypothetical protein M5689_003398 [Euphorbia peplus]|nr:hypothetical protein M5689_003398 [Euphorbia peplus]
MYEWSGTIDPEKRKWMDRAAAEVAHRRVNDRSAIDRLQHQLAELSKRIPTERPRDDSQGVKRSRNAEPFRSVTTFSARRTRSEDREKTPRRGRSEERSPTPPRHKLRLKSQARKVSPDVVKRLTYEDGSRSSRSSSRSRDPKHRRSRGGGSEVEELKRKKRLVDTFDKSLAEGIARALKERDEAVKTKKGGSREGKRHRRRTRAREDSDEGPRGEEGPIQDKDSPLCAKILAAPYPTSFKYPSFDKYSGDSDPVMHVKSFGRSLLVSHVNDALMCKLFPTTLKETAAQWYDCLPTGSIKNWNQLSDSFKAHFVTAIPEKKTVDDLHRVRRGENETLESYMHNFNNVSLKVEPFIISSARKTLAENCRNRDLQMKIMTDRPEDFHALMTMEKSYVVWDEHLEEPSRRPKTVKSEVQDKDQGADRGNGWSSDRWDRPREGQRKPFDKRDRIPLPAPRAQVLMWVEEQKEQIRYPSKGGKPKYNGKYCAFHKLQGHDTEDCEQLAKELDKMAAKGKLKNFFEKYKDQIPDQEGEKRPRGVLNVIIRGSPVDRSTKRKRGNEERRRIDKISKIFDFGSLKGRPTDPHDDALVIKMQVEGFTIRRALLDTGSSANIITRKAYEAFSLDSGRLIPSSSPLVGISGYPVLLLGENLARGRNREYHDQMENYD